MAQYGKRLRLLGMELCYDATSANVVLDAVILDVKRESNDVVAVTVASMLDDTNHTDTACRVYTLTVPHTLTEEDSLVVSARANYAGSSIGLIIGRTTIILEPTTTAAVAPS